MNPPVKPGPLCRYAAPLHHAIAVELQHIELASFYQIPGFQMIGLPSQEVAEAKERIRSAIIESGYDFPQRRLVANLAPAGVRKRGTGSDLALALAILESQLERESTPAPAPVRLIVASGELGLDGALKPVGRPLRTWLAAKEAQAAALIVHPQDAAAIDELRSEMPTLERGVSEIQIIAANSLREAWERRLEHTSTTDLHHRVKPEYAMTNAMTNAVMPDGADDALKLLPPAPAVRRMGMAALAGMHHLLLMGPRGSGKSAAAEWIAGQFEPVDLRQSLQGHLIHELTQTRLPSGPRSRTRAQSTIRRISPQTRPASLEGGFQAGLLIPGELSLAHGGVVIADEFAEWPRDSRELLRIPLERKSMHLHRLGFSAEIPTDFLLLATANFCPCGGTPPRCRCGARRIAEYQARLSGPILDRIDMVAALSGTPQPQASESLPQLRDVRSQIHEARLRLVSQWGALPGTLSAEQTEALIGQVSAVSNGLRRTRISGLRSRHKVCRLALTFAALDGQREPELRHFHEAELLRFELNDSARSFALP